MRHDGRPLNEVAQPLLRIREIVKGYRAVKALRGVSFELRAGERLALLGPNGAGKTTTIRCIAGRTRPDSGGIELLGQRLPPRGGRERLGVVPQELAIYADLTARENLFAFGRFQGLRGAQLAARVDWALQWTELTDRANHLVSGFSGGMKRRVNLACGVLHQPQVLLLDEPTVGVDPQSRERIFRMLNELHAVGVSTLLTTHQLDEAEQCCDRILVIDHGLVVADGTLTQLVDATIGPSRHVKLRVDRALTCPLAPWRLGSDVPSDTLETRISNVANQLPGLVEQIRCAGLGVLNVEVRAPSLHDVFIHLTGHQLRE